MTVRTTGTIPSHLVFLLLGGSPMRVITRKGVVHVNLVPKIRHTAVVYTR